jgi:hypothetical protein
MPVEVSTTHDEIRESMSNVTVYIGGAIIMCITTAVLVTIVALVRPENTAVLATIVGIGTPVTMGLMAAGLNGIHKGVNGRLSQLLIATADSSRAAGKMEAIRQLYFRLQTLDPKSPEYQALADQIRADSLNFFQVVEKRGAS